jgi:hypothetical protein
MEAALVSHPPHKFVLYTCCVNYDFKKWTFEFEISYIRTDVICLCAFFLSTLRKERLANARFEEAKPKNIERNNWAFCAIWQEIP